MKKIFAAVVAFSVTLGSAFSQGVFSANLNGVSELPPNSTGSIGTGSFALSGNTLSFSVSALLLSTVPIDAGVYGPATPAQIGPLIFDLGAPVLTPVGGNNFASYSGVASLTPAQVSQLVANLDYVDILSTAFPAGEIRGQIVLLPEPSSVLLLGMGAGMFFLQRREKA